MATIVHYLLLIVFVGGIAIGVGFLIFLGASKVFEFYTEDYADTKTNLAPLWRYYIPVISDYVFRRMEDVYKRQGLFNR